ncbi:MAG: hypothetical protein DRR19_05490 [Candidatus Parabeggiatoa sp. nov. 1]|nr:MAG: hypothetical protein DRR19_05490 [Gammaproteobacteria bacterium]
MPTFIGEKISAEEWKIYQQIGEIVKDCKYVAGKNFGNYTTKALQEAGTDFLMNHSFQPYEWIDSLIEARDMAGYRD